MRNHISKGLIQVYTGNSKGKTTAALGLGFRAVGHGFTVGVIQFLKGTTYTGEIYAAERLYPLFQIYSYGRGCVKAAMIKSGDAVCDGCMACFVMPDHILESDYDAVRKAVKKVKELFDSEKYDMVIMDEVSAPLNLNMIQKDDFMALLQSRPKNVELVLTGRNMPEWVIDQADLVTEMVQIKHPFEKGIPGRRGIEY